MSDVRVRVGGAVQYVADLPAVGNDVGDRRVVLEPPAGAQSTVYRWDGTAWVPENEPLSGTLRLYVDGTAGDDTAQGTSWAEAWKTLEKLISSLSSVLAGLPDRLAVLVRLRGSFGPTDHLTGLLPINGMSSVVIACDYSDSTILVDGAGTVSAVGGEAPAPYHGMIRVTLGGGITVGAAHLGRFIRFDEGAGLRKATYQIMRVDTVNNYVWCSEKVADFAPWVAPGHAATIFESGAIIQGEIGITAPSPYHGSSATTQKPLVLLNLRTYCSTRIRNCPNVAIAIDARNAAGTGQSIVINECDGATRPSHNSVAASILDELGFSSSASSKMLVGCYGSSGFVSGGVGYLTGFFTGGVRSMGGTYVFNFSSAQYWEAYQCDGMGVFNCIARGGGSYAPLTAQSFSTLSASGVSILDLPAAGHTTNGLVNARHGGSVGCTNVEGNNTGAGSALYGVAFTDGGFITLDATSAAALKGKHGDFRVDNAGDLSFDAAVAIGASEGGGPDIYVGPNAKVHFAGNVTKSATNPSGGGTAAPVLQCRRGAKVTMDATKAFTLPAGSGNNTTDYGANGAIDIETLCDVALGTLAGGNGAAINTAVRVKKGSRLAHAGGAPGWGGAPLDIGGTGAVAMPAAALSDNAAVTPENCWVLPQSA